MLKKRTFVSLLQSLFVALLALAPSVHAALLVEKGLPQSTILVDANAPEYTQESAKRIADYVEKISGAKLPIETQLSAVKTKSILWVGEHPEFSVRHPNVELNLQEDEETLRMTIGEDIIVAGRDVVAENEGEAVQIQAGTHLAVSSFIEEELGVRWLWPGALGTDIPSSDTIDIQELNKRYTPQLKLRSLRIVNYLRGWESIAKTPAGKELKKYVSDPDSWALAYDLEIKQWLNNLRGDSRYTRDSFFNPLMGSWFHLRNRHGFNNWYIDYGKEHPEWFALQADGFRAGTHSAPYPDPRNVKMCISNPEVLEQWFKETKSFFESSPSWVVSESASERDMGWQGYCLCDVCLSWDNQQAEILERPIRWETESRPFYALTDRYAKFWNLAARRLKEEYPDQTHYVATYAYHVTRPAPTITLEDNIIPIFVGIERRSYNRNSEHHMQEQREIWRKWWEAVNRKNRLVWRPNMIHQTLGLPYMFTKRHGENMRFMADHGLMGVITNGSSTHWATQGPQIYLNAKLLWDPYLDVEKTLEDYYQRGFGPAAEYIQAYFELFETLFAKLANQYEGRGYSNYYGPALLFRSIRLDDAPSQNTLGNEGIAKHYYYEQKAQEFLQQAVRAVENSSEVYRQRVNNIVIGFNFLHAQLDCSEAAGALNTQKTPENQKRLEEAVIRRNQIIGESIPHHALDAIYLYREINKAAGRLGKFEGDPKSSKKKQKENKPQKQTEQELMDDFEG